MSEHRRDSVGTVPYSPSRQTGYPSPAATDARDYSFTPDPEPAAEARDNQTRPSWPAYTHGSGRAENDPADRPDPGPVGQPEHRTENQGQYQTDQQEEHGTAYQRQYPDNKKEQWNTEHEKRTERWMKRIDQLNTDQLREHLQEYGAPEQTTEEVTTTRINGATWKQMMENNMTMTN